MIASNLLPLSKAMTRLCPSVIDLLKTHWDQPLSAYLKELWQKPISCSSSIAVQARSQFYAVLKTFFADETLNFALVCSEFERYPLLQTGPHCQLYTNQLDFNALLMSWIGSKMQGMKHVFILNNITRTLQWSQKQGPGWLHLKEDSLNLFGLTPKKMSQRSVCSTYPGLRYCRDRLIQYWDRAELFERKGLELLLGAMSQKEYEGFVAAFTATNLNLLTQWDRDQELRPLILNDRFSALLIAKHLEDGEGLLYRLIFSAQRRNQLKEASFLFEPRQLFLKQGTDYFWGLRDHKIRALTLEDQVLKEKLGPADTALEIALDPQSLRKALLEGILIPNLFLSFLVLCLLPQIRVLGGTRQIGYLPLIQKIFFALLNPQIPEEQELLEELLSNDLNAWGANFIQDQISPIEWIGSLPRGKELSTLSAYYSNQSVATLTQNLAIFMEHPLWKQMQ